MTEETTDPADADDPEATPPIDAEPSGEDAGPEAEAATAPDARPGPVTDGAARAAALNEALLMARPRPAAGSRGGCLRLVAGALALLLLIGIVIGLGVVIVQNRNNHKVDAEGAVPANTSYTLAPGECTLQSRSITGHGVLTNTSDHRQAFFISVRFVDAKGAQVGYRKIRTKTLARKEQLRYAVTVDAEVPTGSTCELPLVNAVVGR